MLTVVVMTQSLVPGVAAAQGERVASSIEIARDIDPSAARDLDLAIDHARRRDAELLIIGLDTPGGRADSTRAMVKSIAAAPMPVIVYVHPGGARADSAGLMLTLAADVAAMAPQTHIGSATPVWGGPPPRSKSEDQMMQDLRRKAINASVAFARALAEDHGRNADLAGRMVRNAENVTAKEAHRARLIDVLAATEQALLRSLDGFAIKGSKAQRLQTRNLGVEHVDVGSLDTGLAHDYANSSWWRSFAYLIGGMATITLVLAGVRSGPAWRRWQRKRRRLKRKRA